MRSRSRAGRLGKYRIFNKNVGVELPLHRNQVDKRRCNFKVTHSRADYLNSSDTDAVMITRKVHAKNLCRGTKLMHWKQCFYKKQRKVVTDKI